MAVSVSVTCLVICSLQETDGQLIALPSDTDPDPDAFPVMVTLRTTSPVPVSWVADVPAALSTVRICALVPKPAGVNCTLMVHEPWAGIGWAWQGSAAMV